MKIEDLTQQGMLRREDADEEDDSMTNPIENLGLTCPVDSADLSDVDSLEDLMDAHCKCVQLREAGQAGLWDDCETCPVLKRLRELDVDGDYFDEDGDWL